MIKTKASLLQKITIILTKRKFHQTLKIVEYQMKKLPRSNFKNFLNQVIGSHCLLLRSNQKGQVSTFEDSWNTINSWLWHGCFIAKTVPLLTNWTDLCSTINGALSIISVSNYIWTFGPIRYLIFYLSGKRKSMEGCFVTKWDWEKLSCLLPWSTHM